MQQNTNPNKVFSFDDPMREVMFEKEYGKRPRISVINVLDCGNDWISSTINFDYKGKKFSMIEEFEPRSNGKTKEVIVKSDNNEKRFKRCFEAEITIVEMMGE